MIAIALLEIALILKYGWSIITQPPPAYVALIWLGCLATLIVYCVHAFAIVPYTQRSKQLIATKID